MPAQRKTQIPATEYVLHPRYGHAPRLTARKYDDSHSSWSREKGIPFIPGTAVQVTPSRQHSLGWGLYNVLFYVDEVRKCRSCRRNYLFFAGEQRFWYEVLGIPMDIHPVRCPLCRRADRQIRRIQREYMELVALAEAARSSSQNLRLAALAIALRDAGVFTARIIPKIRRSLKLVPETQRGLLWKALLSASEL